MMKFSDEQKIQISNLAKSGLSVAEIRKIINVPSKQACQIRQIILNRKIPLTYKGYRTYNIDETIFSKINSEEKAYWLGFIFGDGSIDIKRNTLTIKLNIKDKNHLEKFRLFAKTNKPISKEDKTHCVSLTLVSKLLIKDLLKYNVVPNKTHKDISAPNIHQNLLIHFYRGLLDSDGSIYFTKSTKNNLRVAFSFSGSIENYNFLFEFKKWINLQINKDCGYLCVKKFINKTTNKLNQGCDLSFEGKYSFISLYELFYTNSSIYLDRKKKLADELYIKLTST